MSVDLSVVDPGVQRGRKRRAAGARDRRRARPALLRNDFRRRWQHRRHGGRARKAQELDAGVARAAAFVPQRAERRGGQRRARRARAVDRDARRRRPERSGRHPASCIAARDSAGGRGVQLFMGNRKASRQDTAFRKLQSNIANSVRSGLLGDGTPDTGCGIKLFSRDAFMELPRFDHMHRFLPALFLRHGARVISVPVSHRAAHARHVQVRNAQPPVGGHRRHRRRHVAAPALQAGPAGSRRLKK